MRRAIVRVLLVVFASAAGGGTLVPIELRELSGRSTLIVVGHVVKTRTTRSDNATLEKVSTVQVDSVLRGTWGQPVLRIRTRTGLVFFDDHLKPGDQGVFFLTSTPGGLFEQAYPGSVAFFPQGPFL